MTELLHRNQLPAVDVLSLPDNFLSIDPRDAAGVSSFRRSHGDVRMAYARFAVGAADIKDEQPYTPLGEMVHNSIGELSAFNDEHVLADAWRGASVGQILVEARESRREPRRQAMFTDYPDYQVAQDGDFKIPEVKGIPDIYRKVIKEVVGSALQGLLPSDALEQQARHLQHSKDVGTILDRAGVGARNFDTAFSRVAEGDFKRTSRPSARVGAALLILSTAFVDSTAQMHR